MTTHAGWQLPERFTSAEEEARRVREGVGLAEMSYLPKFDLKGEQVRGHWPLGRGHALALRERPEQADGCMHVTDVTSAYSDLLLAGPKSRDVLRKLTSVNVSETALPNAGIAQGSVAHVNAIVLREDLSVPAYHLLVAREYGEYFWDAVMHAGHEFGIVPFGLQAQELVA